MKKQLGFDAAPAEDEPEAQILRSVHQQTHKGKKKENKGSALRFPFFPGCAGNWLQKVHRHFAVLESMIQRDHKAPVNAGQGHRLFTQQQIKVDFLRLLMNGQVRTEKQGGAMSSKLNYRLSTVLLHCCPTPCYVSGVGAVRVGGSAR